MGDRSGNTASEVGERIRLARIERNFSQEGLASLCPPGPRGPRSATWVYGIEKGTQEPSLGDLLSIAENLQIDVAWLLTGEQSGDSEFLARLRGMEPLLDATGQRTVLAAAETQVEESKRRAEAILSEEEAELIRRFRASSQAERQVTLATAGPPAPPVQEEQTPGQEEDRRGGQSA